MARTLTTEEEQILTDFRLRREIFANYLTEYDKDFTMYTCPSCGYPTLSERSGYEICDICNWEDDGQDNEDADEVTGGPNYELSLTDSRLVIGKELKELAEKLKGEIITNPTIFLEIFKEHNKRISILIKNKKYGEKITETREILINNLIQIKK
mgnify:CR=1 FL=1